MKPNDPGRKRADWRGAAKGASGGGSGKGWTRKAESPTRSKFSYFVQLLFFSLLALSLIVTVLWIAFRPDQAPHLIALCVTRVNAIVPANSLAWEDRQRMKTLFATDEAGSAANNGASRNVRLMLDDRQDYSNDEFVAALRDRLADAKPRNPLQRWFGPKVLLVYLSAHGVVDGDGRPRLILSSDPRGADRGEPTANTSGRSGGGESGTSADGAERTWATSWLDFERIINLLRDPELSWLRSTNVVLILDCNRISEHWPLGILQNNFADAIDELSRNLHEEFPKLHILNSTSGSQVGHAALELNGTVFGQHVIAGLAGKADQKPVGDGNGEVSWKELVEYVQGGVKDWVESNRYALQTPFATTTARDFAINAVPKAPPPELNEELAELEKRRDELLSREKRLHSVWKIHKELSERLWGASQDPGAPGIRLNPLEWSWFEHQLTRLDNLLLAGEAYDREFQDLLTEVVGIAERLRIPPLEIDLGLSIPMVRSGDRSGDGGITAADRDQYKVWLSKIPNEFPAAQAEIREKPYRDLVRLGWEHLIQAPASWETLDKFLKILEVVKGPDIEPVEIHFLRMLHRHLDGSELSKSRDNFHRSVLVRQQAEELVSPRDERVHWWLDRRVDDFDQYRRRAEDLLLIGNDTSVGEAQRIWQAMAVARTESGTPATAPADATDRPPAHQELQRLRDEIALALAVRDDAWAKLASLLQWYARVTRRSDRAAELDEEIPRLINACQQLSAELEVTLRDGSGYAAERLDAVRGPLKKARDLFEKDVKQIRFLQGQRPVQARVEFLDLLSCPLLTGDDRAALRSAIINDLLGRPNSDKPQRDAQAERILNGLLWEQRLLNFGIHPALEMLDWDNRWLGYSDPLPAETIRFDSKVDASNDTARRKELVRGIRFQEAELRRKLDRIKPKIQRPATSGALRITKPERPEWSRRDRLVRHSAGLLVRRTWPEAKDDPHVGLRNFDLHHWYAWQARRWIDDFWARRGEQGAHYFELAANSLIFAAQKNVGVAAEYDGQRLDEILPARVRAAPRGVVLRPADITLAKRVQGTEHSTAFDLHRSLPNGQAAFSIRSKDPQGKQLQQVEGERRIARRALAVDERASTSRVVNYLLDSQELASSGDRAIAEVAYRGHLWQAPFAVGQPGESRIVSWRKLPPPTPEVRVVADESQFVDIMFVLDCSKSMLADREGNQLKLGDERSKWAEALAGLLETTSRMAKSEKVRYRVGLVVFAHRRDSASRTGTPKLNLDVEARFPLQEITPAYHQEIRQFVQGITPQGTTPLYRSIQTAIEKLSTNDDNAGVRRVVVITDGQDTQIARTADRDEGEVVRWDELRDVVGNDKNAAIHTTVVQYALAQEDQKKQAAGELARIEKDHPRRFEVIQAKDPISLSNLLLERIRNARFAVSRLGNEPYQSPEQEISTEPVLIEGWGNREREYEVIYHGLKEPVKSRPVRLAGGESLLLRLAQDGSRLEHVPREKLVGALPRAVVRHEGENRFVVAAQQPRRRGNELIFALSLENADPRRFTPRPRQIWTEISSGTGAEWFFFDPDYDYGDDEQQPLKQMTPQLKFPIVGWPNESSKAQVQFYFSTEPLEDKFDLRVPLRTALDGRKELTIPGLDKVAFMVSVDEPVAGRGTQVRVVESHGGSTGSLGQVAVWIHPTPQRVTHQYFPNASKPEVHHTFELSEGSIEPEVIRFMTKETIRKQFLATEKFEIPVTK